MLGCGTQHSVGMGHRLDSTVLAGFSNLIKESRNYLGGKGSLEIPQSNLAKAGPSGAGDRGRMSPQKRLHASLGSYSRALPPSTNRNSSSCWAEMSHGL